MTQTPADDPNYKDVFLVTHQPGGPVEMSADAVIEDREESHGDYRQQAQFAQLLKGLFHGHKRWSGLPAEQRESVDMIIVKLSRIMAGNSSEPDHWIDIAGYATMIHNLLTKGSHLG